MANENGFEELAKAMGHYTNVGEIGAKSTKNAAEAYRDALMPNIPVGKHSHDSGKLKKLKEAVNVDTDNNGSNVNFGESYWWKFVEHGTRGEHPQPAQNFIRGTWEQNKDKILKILSEDVMKKLGGK